MKNWVRSYIEKLKEKEACLFAAALIILLSLRVWLITGFPKMLIYGPHDDLFYAKAAHYIIHGQWMGPYTQMTLIKEPFYAFFLIVSYLTGLPLFLNETIFFIIACVVLFFAFTPLIKNRWWRLLLLGLLLFCPASLATPDNLRVYREFVYYSLTLYVVAFSIGLFLRLDNRIPILLLWSIGLGLSMGAFMITREEGVWIYPVLFLLLLISIVFIGKNKIDHKAWRSFLLLLPVIIWYIPIFIISTLNYSHYGFWGTSEELDPDFNRVLNTLGRIKSSTWYPFIQVTTEARMKAYAVSPLFNELRGPIESLVITWQPDDDQAMTMKPQWLLQEYTNGGNELGAHFNWLFRDAVSNAGFYSTGKFPSEFYKQLADQLEAACNNGKLDCSSPRIIPLIGSIDSRQFPIIARMFFEDILHLLKQDYIEIAPVDFTTYTYWPDHNVEYIYFEELTYNSLGASGNPDQAAQSIINGKTDLRLTMLRIKDQIMINITNLYEGFTLPVFVACIIAWILIMIFSISNRRRKFQKPYLIISLFLIGLLFSRLMMLAVVDATTSMTGMVYGASNYLFLYAFSLLVLYWTFRHCKEMLVRHALMDASTTTDLIVGKGNEDTDGKKNITTI